VPSADVGGAEHEAFLLGDVPEGSTSTQPPRRYGMSDNWYCPHGIGGPKARRGDCAECEAELAARPNPDAMTGAERAAEVHALLHVEPNGYHFDNLWHRLDALVGRSIYNHEMAFPDRLAAEASTRLHPEPEEAVFGRLRELMGDKPIITIDPRRHPA
jgi:hypothetical protein